MHTGTAALARGVQPGYARAAVDVGDDPADRVMRRGRDGDRRERGVVAVALERRHQAREAVALDRAEIEPDPSTLGDRPRDHVALGELVDEALAVIVAQDGTLAAQRLREQEPAAGTAVGWNCMNSRSATAAPARYAITMPSPMAPSGFVVGSHSAA